MVGSRRLVVLVALGLAAALLPGTAAAGPTAPSSGVKSYTAAFSPDTVRAGTASAVLVLRNCGCEGRRASTVPFGSAELVLPTGVFTQVSADRGWQVLSHVGGVVRLGRGTAVEAGQDLRITLSFSAGGAQRSSSPITVGTRVKQSNDFSGTGNDVALVSPPAALVVSAPPPATAAWNVQPSTVQALGSTSSGPGFTPQRVMCPAPAVLVSDADGLPVPGETVVLPTTATGATGPGLTVSGTGASLSAVTGDDGVATFGTCTAGVAAANLGDDWSVTATVSGTGISTPASAGFDVRPMFGSCAAACSSSLVDAGTSTRAAVQATGGTGPAQLKQFRSDPASDWGDYLGACDPDPAAGGGQTNPFRAVVTVDITDRDKSVRLTWSKAAVQWATNNGASRWQVCLAAEYPFAGSSGPTTVDGLSWWTGALLPCTDPRTSASEGVDASPCLAELGRQKGSEQYAVVRIPNVQGDPRMI